MSLPSTILDSKGTGNGVKVTSRGQLITAPLKFNETYFVSMTSPVIAYNFVEPNTRMQFVIDGIIFSSDKNVSSTNGAEIVIYTANSATSNTPIENLFTLDIGRLDKGSVTGLNVITDEGVWINGSTDDATTNLTIIGYYVEISED